MTDLDLIEEFLCEAVNAGTITEDESNEIRPAFVPHGDVFEIRFDLLADDQFEALDRACTWRERLKG